MVVLQANALTTLAVVLEELELDADGGRRDNILRRIINTTSDLVASWCARQFHAQTITERRGGRGGTELVLRNRPVRTVVSVTDDGDAVTDFELRDIVPGMPGILYRAAGWPWVAAGVPGIIQPPMPGTEAERLVIVYEAGWVTPAQVEAGTFTTRTLPGAVEDAVVELVTSRWRRRGTDTRQSSESNTASTYTYGAEFLPPEAAAALAPYRLWPTTAV
jgi:hypothetical protein